MTLTIGSLFSGTGALDHAVEAVTGATPAWFCEWDEAPSKILAHHWPQVPNYRDVTKVDWSEVEPVDIITGGSPCQDLSQAGKRAGMTEGTRSNLWVNMREAIAVIKPRLVVWENVLGALSATATSDSDMEPSAGLLGNPTGGHLRALGRVLGDLTEIGYDTRWTTLRASDIGAPHHRARVFLIAYPQRNDGGAGAGGGDRWEAPIGTFTTGGPEHSCSAGDENFTDTENNRRERPRTAREGWAGPADGSRGTIDWGAYAPTVRDGGINHAEEGETRSDEILGESGKDRYLLELDCGESVEVRAREIHGERPGNSSLGEQESPQVGIREHRGADTGRVDDRSPMQESQVCKPCASRTCDIGGESTPTGGSGHALPTGASAKRGEPVCGETDGISPMRHMQETPCTNEQTPPHEINWGEYAPAIRRWERIVGPAPAPTELNSGGNPRLNAAFAEWMMGLPAGHVTSPEIGLTRAQQLKALGNGVVPQQAEAALRSLLSTPGMLGAA